MRTYQRTVQAHSAGGWNIAVVFEDGSRGVLDFEPFLEYPCYRSLKSQSVFDSVRADHGTILWPGDIDMAPETVWNSSIKEPAK